MHASQPVRVHDTFPYGCDAVKACLLALFGAHIRQESMPGSFCAELPPHAVAELAAHPLNSLPLSTAAERWYPACSAHMLITAISGEKTELSMTGTIAHANGALKERSFERSSIETALTAILRLLRRDLRNTRLRERPMA